MQLILHRLSQKYGQGFLEFLEGVQGSIGANTSPKLSHHKSLQVPARKRSVLDLSLLNSLLESIACRVFQKKLERILTSILHAL